IPFEGERCLISPMMLIVLLRESVRVSELGSRLEVRLVADVANRSIGARRLASSSSLPFASTIRSRMPPAARTPLSFVVPNILKIQKILQELFPMVGHHRFRMKLDSFDRILAMSQTHNQPVRRGGRDFKRVWQAILLDYQRVITSRLKPVGQSAKN